jgi:selenocysteine lyase/cysteine desulfurase
VLRLSTAYGMVIETLDWMVSTLGIEQVVVDVKFPVRNSEQLVTAVAETLAQYKHGEIKLAIFSHISSLPTMIEPVDALTTICKEKGALVLIDGAHTPGVLELNLEASQYDFYLGNCHKWLYAPKGTAFMWVAKSAQTDTFPEPTVISSSGVRDYVGRFAYTGEMRQLIL